MSKPSSPTPWARSDRHPRRRRSTYAGWRQARAREAAMAGRGVAERRVLKVGAGGAARRARDRLAVEEPLELRVAGRPVGVTMRTPGNDFELAIGYCISERLVAHPDDVH